MNKVTLTLLVADGHDHNTAMRLVESLHQALPFETQVKTEPEPTMEAPRTFGDRLGEMVVEFSEGLTIPERDMILEQLDETTDHAYNVAAGKLAVILTVFSERRS